EIEQRPTRAAGRSYTVAAQRVGGQTGLRRRSSHSVRRYFGRDGKTIQISAIDGSRYVAVIDGGRLCRRRRWNVAAQDAVEIRIEQMSAEECGHVCRTNAPLFGGRQPSGGARLALGIRLVAPVVRAGRRELVWSPVTIEEIVVRPLRQERVLGGIVRRHG